MTDITDCALQQRQDSSMVKSKGHRTALRWMPSTCASVDSPRLIRRREPQPIGVRDNPPLIAEARTPPDWRHYHPLPTHEIRQSPRRNRPVAAIALAPCHNYRHRGGLNLSFNRCKDSIMDANVRDQSKRLIGVLRHSMTSYCLAPRSLSKPYSARHAARHGIVCKVSSAFTVSTAVDGCGMSEDAGMHNVIPVPSIAEWLDEISSLGSPKVPKVELMKTSQYQIKVENCTATKEYISPSPEAACRGENSTVEREAETQHLWPIDLSPVRTDPGGQPKYGFW
ncbi:hypothetical protein CSPX01_10258 [Colletotrichum filicis]|nr:hypothetical protein CSPX01_10258 [Colletotrichum filicis]